MPVALPPFGLPWAMLDRDPRHTGHSNTVGPEDPSVLGVPWPYQAGGPLASQAAIDYFGTAYVGSDDGWLHAVDFTGKGAPIHQTGGAIQASPALSEEMTAESHEAAPSVIYFGSDDGRIYSILRNGTLQWALAPGAQPNQSPIRSSPVVAGIATVLRRVYVGADNGKLYAIFETSPTSATTAWEITTAQPLRTSPALSPKSDRVYVGASDGMLYCLDAFNGTPLANTPVNVGGGPLTTPAVDKRGNVYVANAAGTLFAFDAAGGGIWQQSLGASISAPPTLGVSGEVLVIADDINGPSLYALSATGGVLWSEAIPSPMGAAAPIVDSIGTAYVASNDGWAFGVARRPTTAGSRLSWSVQVDPAGPTLTTPTLDAHGRVYVGASDSRLYVIDEEPAFQIAFHSDLSASPNIDVHSLRETYGKIDAARTLRLTDHPALDQQPAYSLDRSVMAYISDRDGSEDVFLATAIATDEESLTGAGSGFPPTSAEAKPAFTTIDDLTGFSRPPHLRPYLALTSDMSGLNRLVFIDLEAQAAGKTTSLSFTDWATQLGVPSTITQGLEPPNTEQSHIAFSSDGRKMAWRHCRQADKTGQARLLILQGSTWQLSIVGPTYPYDPESPPPRCGDEPCFSPDSRWIAIREGLSLAIYDVLGQQAPVFSTPQSPVGMPTHPNWAPDGSEIAVGLDTGIDVVLFVASGKTYGTFLRLTESLTSDEPYYHHFKMPPPHSLRLNPDREFPDGTIEILGRGFDILHPQNNKVLFTDTQRGPLREALVLSARVNPYEGLGVLRVRVPDLAGHGPITVETRFGSSTTPDFHVLPRPKRIVQPRSVPGAKVRVFGVGFDLATATQHTVTFPAEAGGGVTAQALSGGLDGGGPLGGPEEFLIVEVPSGVGVTGTIQVDNPFGGSVCACSFTRLNPKFTIRRTVNTGPTTGLPQYALQGSAGVSVRLEGSDFPFDPFFGFGTSFANVDASALDPPASPVPINKIQFAQSSPDTARFGPTIFPFPGLGPAHPGGNLNVTASDANLPAANVVAPFRVPLTDIPIIFVPGTGGSSLDLAPGTPIPDPIFQPTDSHFFPWICRSCPPGTPGGPLVHPPFTFNLNPGAVDSRGPRAWMGPEGVGYLLAAAPLGGNQGNHYLDAIAFNIGGTATRPEIVPGTVFYDVDKGPQGIEEVYKPLIDFLTRPRPGWAGRPLCNGLNPPTPTTGTELCFDVSSGINGPVMSGRNAVYLFNLDWRESIPTQEARLNAFVDTVLGRTDVTAKKVVLITHSYGGPVARGYYLNPANGAQAKVDQVISIGGGFQGVVKPLYVIERGTTDPWGIKLGTLSLGIAEWETQALFENWPTSYFQMPNSEDWFFDHGTAIGGKVVNRSYIRDDRRDIFGGLIGAGEITSYAASMDWIASRHNSPGPAGMPGGLAGAQVAFFNPPSGPPVGMGDFRSGTGAIYHHRIIGKGRTDTNVAIAVTLGPSDACFNPILYGALDPIGECLFPTELSQPVLGDGDSTIPYHGALGRTSSSDDRVYVLENNDVVDKVHGVEHGHLPNVAEVLGTTGVSPPVKGLLQMLLEGSACSQPQAPLVFQSQNDVTEII